MSKKTGWGKFALGAAVGATLGVLFAPKSGKETRKELKAKAEELLKKAKEIDIVEVKDKIVCKTQEIIETIKELDKETAKEIALEKIDLLKLKCEELVEYAKEKATPVVEKAADELRKKALSVTKGIEKKLENK